MSKKVCFRKEYCPGKIPKGNRRFHCPANTNAKCEIIPKKPRVIRVKAWIRVVKEDPQWNKCPLRWAATKQCGEYNTPCTILIDQKYLRRKP